MSEQRQVKSVNLGDLVASRYGNGWMIFKVIEIVPPGTYHSNVIGRRTFVTEQLLQRNGTKAKKRYGRLPRRTFHESWLNATYTGTRCRLLEDVIVEWSKNVETYTKIFTDHYTQLRNANKRKSNSTQHVVATNPSSDVHLGVPEVCTLGADDTQSVLQELCKLTGHTYSDVHQEGTRESSVTPVDRQTARDARFLSRDFDEINSW